MDRVKKFIQKIIHSANLSGIGHTTTSHTKTTTAVHKGNNNATSKHGSTGSCGSNSHTSSPTKSLKKEVQTIHYPPTPVNILVVGDSKSGKTELVDLVLAALKHQDFKYKVDDREFELFLDEVDPQDMTAFNFTTFPRKLEHTDVVIYVLNLNSKVHWKEHCNFIQDCMELEEITIPVLLVGTQHRITTDFDITISDYDSIAVMDVASFIEQSDSPMYHGFVESDFGSDQPFEIKHVIEPALRSVLVGCHHSKI